MRVRVFLGRYSQIMAAVGCAVSVGGLLGAHAYVDKFKIYRSAKVEGGQVVFCDDYFRELLLDVGQRLGMPEDDLRRLVLYHTSYDGPTYHGCLRSPLHSLLPSRLLPIAGIGLPLYYRHRFLDDTTYEQLKINGKPISLEADSPEGVRLRRQMVLTEDAKKFLLARQLVYLDSNLDLQQDCASVAAAYAAYQGAFLANRIVRPLPLLPLASRLFVYAAIVGVAFLLKTEAVEVASSRVHQRADKEAARLHPRLHSGALEFYDKMIERNKLLHVLGFSRQFSRLGNETTGLLVLGGRSGGNCHVRLSRLMGGGKEGSS